MMSALMLAGCGSEIPELTDEQMELVEDYSAALLMKYDSTSPSRLLPEGYDSGISTVVVTDDEGNEAEAVEEEPEEGETVLSNAEPEVTEESLDVVDNTTGETVQASGTAEESFSDYLAASGIDMEYDYWEILDSYPEDNDNLYFSTDASAGNKLLVIHFLLSAVGDAGQDVNLAGLGLKYRVTINGSQTKKIMQTMLENDILSYTGTVVPNQMVDIVAITEIGEDEAANIANLDFIVKGSDFSTSMSLQ